ncbi:MAG: electron transport complex subunit RsxB [Xanthomonadales bacterium]|nr:electron transport complex subunit RsxB [Xanthomonadales bacterium]
MTAAIIILTSLALIFGLALGYAAIRFRLEGNPVADQIEALLPQTQCAQCGYPGCRPYAEAIAADEVDINRCPPGGEAGIKQLADLLGKEPIPLDADAGIEKALPEVAIIHEDICIGCTKCIQACPVDAILGAAKKMHTIIAAECTGCELCIPPCPVDCIDMIPVSIDLSNWQSDKPVPITTISKQLSSADNAGEAVA